MLTFHLDIQLQQVPRYTTTVLKGLPLIAVGTTSVITMPNQLSNPLSVVQRARLVFSLYATVLHLLTSEYNMYCRSGYGVK